MTQGSVVLRRENLMHIFFSCLVFSSFSNSDICFGVCNNAIGCFWQRLVLTLWSGGLCDVTIFCDTWHFGIIHSIFFFVCF
jgi:hypothetical protein